MGGNHNQVDRVTKAMKSSDNPPPPVYFLFKDHKEEVEGEPCPTTRQVCAAFKDHNEEVEGEPYPTTRQVCAAREGLLARLSHLASRILTPVADKLYDLEGTECSNGEEMKRGIQDTNKKVAENSSERMEGSEELVIMSQDVNGLYLSLDREETVRIIGMYRSVYVISLYGAECSRSRPSDM